MLDKDFYLVYRNEDQEYRTLGGYDTEEEAAEAYDEEMQQATKEVENGAAPYETVIDSLDLLTKEEAIEMGL